MTVGIDIKQIGICNIKKINDLNLRIKKFWESGNQGTNFKEIFDCMNWCIKIGPKIISGRNISVVHDRWGTVGLKKRLRKDSDMYKFRRHKNK